MTARAALVTGAGHRLGRAIAVGLARDGYDIAVHYRSSPADADATVAACQAQGVRAVAIAADVTNAGACAELVASAQRHLGAVAVLVNSAANFRSGAWDAIDEEHFDDSLAVNVKAPFFCAQAAAPAMIAAGFGRIVNVADVAGLRPWTNYLAHSASKAALISLTQGLARALAPSVLVNAVAPGPVLMPDGADGAVIARSAATTAVGRIGTPDDIVSAVRYLVAADFVTGHTLVVDGGRLVWTA